MQPESAALAVSALVPPHAMARATTRAKSNTRSGVRAAKASRRPIAFRDKSRIRVTSRDADCAAPHRSQSWSEGPRRSSESCSGATSQPYTDGMGEVSATADPISVAPAAIGKYWPIGRLGRGGMADVFLALARGPQRVDKLVVIKRLHDPDDAEMIQMFLDEARLGARLSHPNIVQTYEVAEAKGEYFIAMEYLEGQPLSELVKQLEARSIVMSEALVAHIARQALRGLHYAHEFCDFDGKSLGIVHRDVSPHNLFITYGGEVKLLDFGIAKATLNAARTESGVLKGKVRYMAPEQAASREVDRRADIFSFGVVFWEMLARRQLFVGDPMAVLQSLQNAHIPRLRSVRPEVSPALEAIAHKALQPSRDDRYATAEEMRLDVERFVRAQAAEASDEELGQLVSQFFEGARDRLRERIREHVAKIVLSVDDTPVVRHLVSTRDLPLLHTTSGDVPTSMPPLTSMPAVPWTRSRWRMRAFIVLAVVSTLALAVLWGTNRARAPARPSATAEEHPAPATATLRVETNPSGAIVEWNGARFGPTPTEFPIDPGMQTFQILRDGYETASVTLDVARGESKTHIVALQPKIERVAPPPAISAAASSRAASPHPRAPKPSSSATPASSASSSSRAPAASSAPSSRPRIQMIDGRDLP
jgi:serine/threonine protein kinase